MTHIQLLDVDLADSIRCLAAYAESKKQKVTDG